MAKSRTIRLTTGVLFTGQKIPVAYFASVYDLRHRCTSVAKIVAVSAAAIPLCLTLFPGSERCFKPLNLFMGFIFTFIFYFLLDDQ